MQQLHMVHEWASGPTGTAVIGFACALMTAVLIELNARKEHELGNWAERTVSDERGELPSVLSVHRQNRIWFLVGFAIMMVVATANAVHALS